MARFDRESDARPAFAAGDNGEDEVFGARGHTRLPQYARGREGRIECFRGFHILPDTNMAGQNRPASYCRLTSRLKSSARME